MKAYTAKTINYMIIRNITPQPPKGGVWSNEFD